MSKKYSGFIIPQIKKSIQRDSFSCGAHAVKAITNYAGKRYKITHIRKMLKTSEENGTRQTAIENFFKKIGMSYKIITHAKTCDIESEIIKFNPVLVAIDNCEHWVVIYGYSKKCFYILDSINYICNKRISKKIFKKFWDGWIMSVKCF